MTRPNHAHMYCDQGYSSVFVNWTKQVCLQTRLRWWQWWRTPDIIWLLLSTFHSNWDSYFCNEYIADVWSWCDIYIHICLVYECVYYCKILVLWFVKRHKQQCYIGDMRLSKCPINIITLNTICFVEKWKFASKLNHNFVDFQPR